MTISYRKVREWVFHDIEQSYDWKDVALYSLGVGFAHDPTDESQLRFVYEKDMLAPPTLPVVLGAPGFWVKDPESGVDWVKVLHGEHALTLHRPIPVRSSVISRMRVKGIVDKGRDKGAILVQERKLYEKASGELLATIDHLTFCRGDGGFSELPDNGPRGGDPAPPAKPPVPDTPPDLSCDLPTIPQAGLLYRLCGDFNPLHAEPAVASAGGFPRPILHGLASFSIAGHAILKSCCAYDPTRLKSLGLRFSGPVYPGETLRTEIWTRPGKVQFRTRSVERDAIVLSNGIAEVA